MEEEIKTLNEVIDQETHWLLLFENGGVSKEKEKVIGTPFKGCRIRLRKKSRSHKIEEIEVINQFVPDETSKEEVRLAAVA